MDQKGRNSKNEGGRHVFHCGSAGLYGSCGPLISFALIGTWHLAIRISLILQEAEPRAFVHKPFCIARPPFSLSIAGAAPALGFRNGGGGLGR